MKKVNRVYLLLVVILAVAFVMGIAAPVAAQDLTQQERDLEEMRQAIRALPGPTELTEADRPAVLEARRMAEAVMARYGLTKADLCGVTVVLDLALHALGLPPLADEVTALPPTGGVLPVSAGLISLLAGAAFLIPRKRA